MRKGPGLSALSRQSIYTSSYSTLSSSISTSQITSLQSSLESFRELLIEFSMKHKKDIKDDPAFRHQFQKMCSSLGIDPLVGSSRSSGSGGVWGMLGISEFEYELCVQLVDVCVSSRGQNGGLIRLDEVIRRVERLRSGGKDRSSITDVKGKTNEGDVTEQDILRCLKILEPLKSGYTVHTIQSTKYIRSVPSELNMDQSILLSIAATTGGRLNKREVRGQTGWGEDRINVGLRDCVMEHGLGWVDDQSFAFDHLSGSGVVENQIRGDVWIIAATNFEVV
ncbi:hypothetical protein I302_101239 [Kwoniella bestiolae CBS 10118]|uniref:Vacuolar-sorting protein SNF8 n=1 Tax=Kwoniella bestiolae CBS 10118 TaxID=1296100 RepID=A0A1B9G7F3_9TREE|nr:hypothetical protein I302_04611 [Kwoniella bestiolae CBS 10118]OCF26920.1 hypothetical protein I302_04611 [Kwoniella bestiolae CBS 10118]